MIALLLILLTTSPVDRLRGDEPVFPGAWEGVWEIEGVERPCGTKGGGSTALRDTLCAGETLADFFGGFVQCSGTIDDDTIDASCGGVVPVLPSCNAIVNLTIDGSRQGDVAEFLIRTDVDYIGFCPFEDGCTEFVQTASRVAEESGCPVTPLLPSSWSRIKSTYR